MSIKFFSDIRCTYKCLHYITNNTNNVNTKIVTSKRMYQKRLNWIDLPRRSKVRRPQLFKKLNNIAQIKQQFIDKWKIRNS